MKLKLFTHRILSRAVKALTHLRRRSSTDHLTREQEGDRRRIFKSIGMIASANLLATAFAVVGSFVQAHFIAPDDLGFVRKYSIVGGYAIFLSFGLFNILQREYPVLMGKGEEDRARRAAAIGQTWCLLASIVVCSVLAVLSLIDFLHGRWREGCAWFIQVVAVWSILYGGYLTTTFRSGHEFERYAKGSLLSSVTGLAVLPLFVVWPFSALVLRSVAGSIVMSTYLHRMRPVKVGFLLPLMEFFDLVKRGMRLFVGTYIRYHFWPTVELWLILWMAGDEGVGLFIFAIMICEGGLQLTTAINQVYSPRIAQRFGETGSLAACLRYSLKPTVINTMIALVITGTIWVVFPPVVEMFFPKYMAAIPIVRVLAFDIIVVGLSLPVFMVQVLEDYATQTAAAVIGIGMLAGVAYMLHQAGMGIMSVVWGTIAGRFTFVAISLLSLGMRLGREPLSPVSETIA
ncbi:MAG TPA: hypothetical protein VK470_05660 [Bacteroidota bacterium]|nr:hypothetical protein [Bacteroidota bacterium]